MSVYAHLYGQHDYNKHPFVPIGMEALVHDKPHKQRTYAEHCRKAVGILTDDCKAFSLANGRERAPMNWVIRSLDD
jgi:hypothetical protein